MRRRRKIPRSRPVLRLWIGLLECALRERRVRTDGRLSGTFFSSPARRRPSRARSRSRVSRRPRTENARRSLRDSLVKVQRLLFLYKEPRGRSRLTKERAACFFLDKRPRASPRSCARLDTHAQVAAFAGCNASGVTLVDRSVQRRYRFAFFRFVRGNSVSYFRSLQCGVRWIRFLKFKKRFQRMRRV